MRIEIQHVLGLDDEKYTKYLKKCEENDIVPLKLVRDLTREEYAEYCIDYEQRCYCPPPTPPRSYETDPDILDSVYTEYIEDAMVDHTIGFFSRHLTDEESEMYDRSRMALLDHYRQIDLQQQELQQQLQQQQEEEFRLQQQALLQQRLGHPDFLPRFSRSGNPGGNWFGQSIGESIASFDF